ncbi:hypothetical protein ACLB1E_34880 [Escherichia coli]
MHYDRLMEAIRGKIIEVVQRAPGSGFPNLCSLATMVAGFTE